MAKAIDRMSKQMRIDLGVTGELKRDLDAPEPEEKYADPYADGYSEGLKSFNQRYGRVESPREENFKRPGPVDLNDDPGVRWVNPERDDYKTRGGPFLCDGKYYDNPPVGKPYRAMGWSFSSEDAKRTGWDGPSFE